MDAHFAIFQEMAVILALATTVGIVGVLLKQPLLIAFIVAGILAGPLRAISFARPVI